MLLYPEGMIKLNGSAGEIISCCDGKHTIEQIIDTLAARFPEAEGLSSDTVEFFKVAHEQQWIELD